MTGGPPGYPPPPGYPQHRPASPPPPPGYPPYAVAWPPHPRGPAPGLRYAGFWIRALGGLIDSATTFGLIVVLVGIATPFEGRSDTAAATAAALLSIVGIGGYAVLQIVVPGRFGGTLGMRILGLWIVREQDGSQIGYGLAAGRFGVCIALWWFTAGIGALVDLLFVAFDARKQSVHDKACSTLVVWRA